MADFILKSYLLDIPSLEKKHSGKYLSKVLINTLEDYNITKDIIR